MKEKTRLVKKGTEQTRKVEPQKRQESPEAMEARLRREWTEQREAARGADPRAAFRKLFKN